MAAAAGTETDSGCTASKRFACMLCWQQLCEAGMRVLPHLPFIFLQHAYSCAVIWALGRAHAIAGASNDRTSARTNAR